jgi:hypothetical protein
LAKTGSGQTQGNLRKEAFVEQVERCVTASPSNISLVCPPQTWTLSNRLLEFGPSVLRWW